MGNIYVNNRWKKEDKVNEYNDMAKPFFYVY